MDRGALWDTVRGVAKSQTRLSDFTSFHFATNVMKGGEESMKSILLHW